MAQATRSDQAMARTPDADEGCSLTCECWDCRSWRRHLLRLAAVALLACGLGGELAWQRGLWLAHEATSDDPVALARVDGDAVGAWF